VNGLEKSPRRVKRAQQEKVRTQEWREGILDIESIKKANNTLIATLNDSLQIAEDGKKPRNLALEELNRAEKELKDTLISIKQSRTRFHLLMIKNF